MPTRLRKKRGNAMMETTDPSLSGQRECGVRSCSGRIHVHYTSEEKPRKSPCRRSKEGDIMPSHVPQEIQTYSPTKKRREYFGDMLLLERAMVAFLRFISPNAERHMGARKVLEDAAFALLSLGLHVKVFGSWCTGLCIPKSDIDFVAIPFDTLPASADFRKGRENNFLIDKLTREEEISYMSKQERQRFFCDLLRIVANKLRSLGVFHTIKLISHAKIPIVKAIHSHRSDIDITFNQDGLQSSNFLCHEFKEPKFRLARGLIILLKALLANRGLGDPSIGGLGSFPVSVMVLWFLHDEVAVQFPPDLRDSYSACFVGLLKYYGMQFNFMTTAIDYANKRTFKKPYSTELCIMNPLYPNVNCAVAASRFASRVVPLFSEWYKKFSYFLNPNADLYTVGEVVEKAFHSSIAAVGDTSEWCNHLHQYFPVKTAATHQHLWDLQTSFYTGDPLGI